MLFVKNQSTIFITQIYSYLSILAWDQGLRTHYKEIIRWCKSLYRLCVVATAAMYSRTSFVYKWKISKQQVCKKKNAVMVILVYFAQIQLC